MGLVMVVVVVVGGGGGVLKRLQELKDQRLDLSCGLDLVDGVQMGDEQPDGTVVVTLHLDDYLKDTPEFPKLLACCSEFGHKI